MEGILLTRRTKCRWVFHVECLPEGPEPRKWALRMGFCWRGRGQGHQGLLKQQGGLMKSPTARTHHWIGSIRLQKSHGSSGRGYTSQDTKPGRSYEDFFLGTKNCCSSYQCLMLSCEMTNKPPILYVLLAHLFSLLLFCFVLLCSTCLCIQ